MYDPSKVLHMKDYVIHGVTYGRDYVIQGVRGTRMAM